MERGGSRRPQGGHAAATALLPCPSLPLLEPPTSQGDPLRRQREGRPGIIEQAQRVADEQQVADAERMLLEGFNMNDYLSQLQQIRKMGGISKMIGMLPGGERMMRQSGTHMDESQLTNIESIIRSMTKEERLKPKKINGQRRRRIAAGSGHSVQEVNQVIKQWGEMNKMMGKMRQAMDAGPRKSKRKLRGMMRDMGMEGLGRGLGGNLPF